MGQPRFYLGAQELTVKHATGQVTGLRYYTFAGQTVAVRTGLAYSTVSSIFSDRHGTGEVQIPNVTGARVHRYTDPFGVPRGPQAGGWTGDHGFLDKPKDTSGLTAIGARMYDPSLGKFISVDPVMDLTDPQQWNGYAYAHNNPTTYSDPTGLREFANDDPRDDTQEQIASAVAHSSGRGSDSGTSTGGGEGPDPFDEEAAEHDGSHRIDEKVQDSKRKESVYDPPERAVMHDTWDAFFDSSRNFRQLLGVFGTAISFADYCAINDCFDEGWNFYRDPAFWLTAVQVANEEAMAVIYGVAGSMIGGAVGASFGGLLGTITLPIIGTVGGAAAGGVVVGAIGAGVGTAVGGSAGARVNQGLGEYARNRKWVD